MEASQHPIAQYMILVCWDVSCGGGLHGQQCAYIMINLDNNMLQYSHLPGNLNGSAFIQRAL